MRKWIGKVIICALTVFMVQYTGVFFQGLDGRQFNVGNKLVLKTSASDTLLNSSDTNPAEMSQSNPVDTSQENLADTSEENLTTPSASIQGWQEDDAGRYFYIFGEKVTGYKEIEDKAYYFGTDGILKESEWIKTNNGETYYADSNGQLHTGWKKENGKKYYFSEKNCQMVTGWKKIDGKNYYFDTGKKNKGILQRNCIAGTKDCGYGYVDAEGMKVTSQEIVSAVKFVNCYSSAKDAKNVRLKKCYRALWKKYPYKRYYEKPSAKKMSRYAQDMFTNKCGNCYRYAASFACIAKVLGYDARVAHGKISSTHGGMTPHGWTEIKVKGHWYMCDANMQRNFPRISSYMRSSRQYAYAHTRSGSYTLTFKKGKAHWK